MAINKRDLELIASVVERILDGRQPNATRTVKAKTAKAEKVELSTMPKSSVVLKPYGETKDGRSKFYGKVKRQDGYDSFFATSDKQSNKAMKLDVPALKLESDPYVKKSRRANRFDRFRGEVAIKGMAVEIHRYVTK